MAILNRERTPNRLLVWKKMLGTQREPTGQCGPVDLDLLWIGDRAPFPPGSNGRLCIAEDPGQLPGATECREDGSDI